MNRLFVVMMLAACLAFSAAASAQAPVKAAVVTDGISEFWTQFREASDKEGADAGVALDVKMPSPATPEQQQQIIQQLVDGGASIVAVCPVEPEKQAAYLKSLSGRVSLILLMKDGADSGCKAWVGVEPKDTGLAAAELTASSVPGGLKVAVFLKDKEDAADKAFLAGLEEGLKAGDYLMDVVQEDKGDRSLTAAHAAELMDKRPELACYIGSRPHHVPVILKAAREMKRAGVIGLVGPGDNSPDTRAALKTGEITGLIRIDGGEAARQTFAAVKGVAAGGGPADGRYPVKPVAEKTPAVRGLQDKINALQAPWDTQNTPIINMPQPSFE